jgi:hypothetical protein
MEKYFLKGTELTKKEFDIFVANKRIKNIL